MYEQDKRIVMTLDAGGTNFVFSAIQGCKEIINPIGIPAVADNLQGCLLTLVEGFEKVKTQNKLRPQHIKKIVDTYRERKEIEKYSHLATLQEVAENDYNLNIPRYVDTFEEEEPIDIHAVMKEIKELEAKRADLDKEIEGYLKELGLVE